MIPLPLLNGVVFFNRSPAAAPLFVCLTNEKVLYPLLNGVIFFNRGIADITPFVILS